MIGIDEVGRGSWAGPLLVVAARQIHDLPIGLADSKVLSKTRREALVGSIHKSCQLGEGWVEPAEIDEFGLAGAMRLGVSRALRSLAAKNEEEIIMDGPINYCPLAFKNVKCLIDADATESLVSAASIYAKVQRDQYMVKMSLNFPGYSFESHVGYGTKAHLKALQKLGVCALHRRSFKPIQLFL
jgi:ribonuclease HII